MSCFCNSEFTIGNKCEQFGFGIISSENQNHLVEFQNSKTDLWHVPTNFARKLLQSIQPTIRLKNDVAVFTVFSVQMKQML